MTKISVLIADDHWHLRRGVRESLADAPDIEVVGEAEDGKKTLVLAYQLQPNIVLLDYRIPEDEEKMAITVTAELYEKQPQSKVIIFSFYDYRLYLEQSFQFGARGYLLKSCQEHELAQAIRHVHEGNIYIPPNLQQRLMNKRSMALLTKTEACICRLLIQGFERQEIAQLLDIKPKTFDNHRLHIFQKLGVENEVELVLYAVKAGWLDERLA